MHISYLCEGGMPLMIYNIFPKQQTPTSTTAKQTNGATSSNATDAKQTVPNLNKNATIPKKPSGNNAGGSVR